MIALRRIVLLNVASILLLAAAGCSALTPSTPTQAPTVTPAPVVISPALSATPPPATSIPAGSHPTATAALPPTQALAPATRVNFAPGATFIVVNGSLAAGGVTRYVLNVAANQLMEVSFSSPAENQPQIVITGADGAVLKNAMSTPSFFRGTVPATQDYTIRVSAGSLPVTYAMNVMIPERITFAAGATEVVVQGRVEPQSNHQYVINLGAGQLFDLALPVSEGLHTSIYGVDGTVLQSGMGGGAGFRGTVPSAQDYIIQVVPEGNSVSYSMTIVVPQRISFAAGATSATASGSLAAHESHQFVVNAQANQTLDVQFTPEGSAKMSIYGVDGTVLWSGMGEGTHFSGKLPVAQDYFIVFQAGDQPVQFNLVVTIK